jgi:hypothetical protein
MTAATTRHASPAAAPRTGRRVAALPNDPGLEALLADKRLSAAAKLVATVLVKHWAWYKSSCYPSNRSIAARCGYSPGHVARCLHELEQGGWIRREQQATGTRLIVLCWRGTPCKDAGGGSATLQGDPPAKARTELIVSVNERIEPIRSERPERSRPEASPTTFPAPGGLAEAIPAPLAALLPPPPVPPAPERVARTALAPSPLAVPALPPSARVGPREATRAILRAPAGPTPQAAPGPGLGDRAASIAAGPYQSPASPPCALQLARSRSSQSESPPELGPPALVIAPDAPRGLANPPPIEPPQAAPVPTTSPPTTGPALPLTAEQQARLEALPAATRDLVLTWLLTGDPILVAEAKKKLVPPRPRPEAPQTLPEVLGRIREDPSFPALAADWLCTVLNDRKSYSGFKSRCEAAWRGELSPDQLVSAYQQALGPRAKNPGAIFMVAVRCGVRDG